MNVTSMPIRRTLTVMVAVTALLLGFAAIRAASAWTADAAPLVASPASATSIEAALADEQARSADLQARLSAITGQTEEMSVALKAAQDRIVADALHAETLSEDLTAATKKLKALEKSIRQAAAAAVRAQTVTVVRTTTTVANTPVSHEDDEEEDDD
jgi:chromosome segregation ATPase